MSTKPIRLFWQGEEHGEINFGDTISPLLIKVFSGKDVVYSHIGRCDLVAVGSILDKVVKKLYKRKFYLRFDKVKVWGSGSFGPEYISRHKNLDIYAVRGPLTRDAMRLPPSTPMGDPVLLIDRFCPAAAKKFRWGIIPHIFDRKLEVIKKMHDSTPDSCVIDLGDPDLIGTARKISACDFIISSSLHGLIAADALGIPHVWMSISKNVTRAEWKFQDYLLGVGREVAGPIEVCNDLRALENQALMADRKLIEERKRGLEVSFKKMGL